MKRYEVSIRASLQQRGELDRVDHLPFLPVVSIRASLQQRGERLFERLIPCFSGFNPRLTSAARRTPRSVCFTQTTSVSIRASLQQRGERAPRNQRADSLSVSIRASLQQRGEPNGWSIPHRLHRSFNPRLTSAARRTFSNAISFRDPLSFNPRLTSAARRTFLSIRRSRLTGFQSAPHFSS